VKRGAKPILLKDIVDAALVESEKNGFSVGKY
jgi:acetyl-CoA synthetase